LSLKRWTNCGQWKKSIRFTETGWKDYLYWQGQDKKALKQINKLIEDIERNGYDGIGGFTGD